MPLRTVKDPGPNVRTRGSRRRSISRKPTDMGQPLTRLHRRRQPGVLAAAIALRAGRTSRPPSTPIVTGTPPTPALIVNMGRLNSTVGPRRLVTVIRRIRSYGDHI